MKRLIFMITGAMATYAGTDVWTPVGPYGGYVSALVADPSNPGTLYAGTGGVAGAPGGLYKTTDGGTNWTLLNPLLGAASIAIDPQNTNTIYVGLRGSSNSGAWVFKSTDGGASFNLFELGAPRGGHFWIINFGSGDAGHRLCGLQCWLKHHV
jgi:photosystem II stability/assembly factor-like uncharacterized protein